MISKKTLIVIVGILLWGLIGGGIWYSSQISNSESTKTVLGANDSKIAEPSKNIDPPKKQIIQNTPPPVKVQPQSAVVEQQSTGPDIFLTGNGCNQDSKFGSSCKLQSSVSSGLTLKSCTDENLTNCNFYSFEIGRRAGNTQYILQKYEENGDILLDILSYSIDQNTLSTIKTVLFQSVNDGSSEAKNGNSEYLNTLSQYR
jgi:hypothetical protein